MTGEYPNPKSSLVGGAGNAALNGVIGKAILDEAVKIPLGKAALAGLTGLGIFAGGAVGAVIVVALGAVCIKDCYEFAEKLRYNQADAENPPQPRSP